MSIKQGVVEQDFHEKNIRKILNFGHTIGHAIESLFLKQGKPILHGDAVAIGIICETRLAFLEGLIDENTQKAVVDGISKFFPYIDISSLNDAEMYSLMLKDKKNTSDSPSFSLISSVGICNFDHKSKLENIILTLDFYKKHEF
jgi:3-dehydroquinate synthase